MPIYFQDILVKRTKDKSKNWPNPSNKMKMYIITNKVKLYIITKIIKMYIVTKKENVYYYNKKQRKTIVYTFIS